MKQGSFDRVITDAKRLGLDIDVVILETSAHTAREAADNQGCDVGQIVKSMIFERTDDQTLQLVLVSGAHNASMARLKAHFGCKLVPAKPDKIRKLTGFAIGGVAPIGHLNEIPVVMDKMLFDYDTVWAAAGTPLSVFSVKPQALCNAVRATVLDL